MDKNRYYTKEASITDAAKLTYQTALFLAVLPAVLGYAVGRGYSYLSTPSKDELDATQLNALANETDLLKDRLKTLPERPPKEKKSADLSWRGGFR